MIERPKVSTLTKAKTIYKLHCGECNWEQIIASEIDAELKSCPWCGWGDFEISEIQKTGGYQTINCAAHGNITVIITSQNVEPEDFLDNLICPYCK